MFLLDTNVVSELRRGRNANESVRSWAAAQDAATQFLSVVSIQELQYGILLKRRRDPGEAARIEAWLRNQILHDFDGRILVLDKDIALAVAALHVPARRPERDAWIAATALLHGLTVVTRNTRDFQGTGVGLLNPWDA